MLYSIGHKKGISEDWCVKSLDYLCISTCIFLVLIIELEANIQTIWVDTFFFSGVIAWK